MEAIDRAVRAAIYDLLARGEPGPTPDAVAIATGVSAHEVAASFQRLADDHRIHLVPGETRVAMAHPFSGVPTDYRVVIGERAWFGNCGWDAFAILALLGDGEVRAELPLGGGEMTWDVRNGTVSPDGLVNLVVPARDFWVDVGFT